MPQFEKDDIQMYINKLKMWQFITEVDKKKQAPMIWMSLPKNDSSNIKELVNNSIGFKDLAKDDRMDKQVALFKKAFQQEEELEAFTEWKEFNRLER